MQTELIDVPCISSSRHHLNSKSIAYYIKMTGDGAISTNGISLNGANESTGFGSGTSNTSINIVYDNLSRDLLLWRLNYEKVLKLMPVIVYVAVCSVLGIIGNSLVCYVYSFRLHRSPSRFFIIFLAVLDLISCVVGACSELIDLSQPLIFRATWSCKILRFGLSFTIIAASFTLTCVAFDRYYKVCKPLKAFPVRKVKTLCCVVTILSLAFSAPALLIFGQKTVTIEHYEFQGTECSSADAVKGTPLPKIYYAVLFTAFLILLASFICLYIRIGFEIWKRKKLTIGETLPALIKEIKRCRIATEETSSPSCQTDEELPVINTRDYCDACAINEEDGYCDFNDEGTTKCNGANAEVIKRRKIQPKLKRQKSYLGRMSIRTLRTTSIFFAVSTGFVISFLPYLIANLLKYTKVAFHEFHSISEEVGYNFLVRSYFISNFINPIIYSALNVNFRKECKKFTKILFGKLKRCCLCQSK